MFAEGKAYASLQGLEFLHQHEVVHLDIKPDNIYLQNGRCKVGDFGLAIKEHQWVCLLSYTSQQPTNRSKQAEAATMCQ